MTRTRTRRGAGALLLVVIGLGSIGALGALGVRPAGAAAPDQQGWWWTLNPGSVPEVGQPAPPPSPPDVPAKGLLVEGPAGSSAPTGAAPSAPVGGSSNASAPVADAALVYYLPVGGSASTLTLHVAAKSASTPTATLELCPLVNPVVNAEQGGPGADAPPYDCTHNVSAAASAGGGTYQFQVGELATDGALAVAILPTNPTDRVVLDQPDANSLTEQAPPAGSGAVPQTTSTSNGLTQTPSFATPFAASVPTFAIPPFGAPSPATGSPPAAPASPAGSSPAAASPRSYSGIPVLGVFNGDNASPLTVALVCAGLLGGAALWFMAGRRRADEGALAEVAVTD